MDRPNQPETPVSDGSVEQIGTKREWIRPELRSMFAGQAESAGDTSVDGIDTLS